MSDVRSPCICRRALILAHCRGITRPFTPTQRGTPACRSAACRTARVRRIDTAYESPDPAAASTPEQQMPVATLGPQEHESRSPVHAPAAGCNCRCTMGLIAGAVRLCLPFLGRAVRPRSAQRWAMRAPQPRLQALVSGDRRAAGSGTDRSTKTHLRSSLVVLGADRRASMISNLLIMVIVGGYETFVSRDESRRPSGPAGMAVRMSTPRC